jgi:hypothetical protein
MRKAVDTLLFSGDFTPTTFNLAFFMHSLFREDIERESKSLREEKDASYIEFLTDTGSIPRPATTPVPGVPLETVAMPCRRPCARCRRRRRRRAPPAHTPVRGPRRRNAGAAAAGAAPPREHPATRSPPTASPRTRIRRSQLDRLRVHVPQDEAKSGSKMPLIAGGIAAALLLGRRRLVRLDEDADAGVPAVPPTTTLSAEAAAAVARVKELEDKLKAIEAEKAAAEAKAAEDAKKKVEAAGGRQGPGGRPGRAREGAGRGDEEGAGGAGEEGAGRAQASRRGEEGRGGPAGRGAAEAGRGRGARRGAQAATTTLPAPTTTTAPPAPAIRAGSLVNLSDPGVIAPVAERVSPPLYPEIARRQNLEGTVELNVLVDERGCRRRRAGGDGCGREVGPQRGRGRQRPQATLPPGDEGRRAREGLGAGPGPVQAAEVLARARTRPPASDEDPNEKGGRLAPLFTSNRSDERFSTSRRPACRRRARRRPAPASPRGSRRSGPPSSAAARRSTAAFCRAERTTLVGSMTPASTRFSYFSFCALKPSSAFFDSRTLDTTTAPS